jgi:hypothetical protein
MKPRVDGSKHAKHKLVYSSNLGGPPLKEGVPEATKPLMNDEHRGWGAGGTDIKIKISEYIPSIVFFQ